MSMRDETRWYAKRWAWCKSRMPGVPIEKRKRWYAWLDGWTDYPMLSLTLLFVPIVFLGDVVPLTDGQKLAVDIAGWALWSVFAVEFLGMLYLSTTRGDYLRGGWWELPVIIVTTPGLPFGFLRPLRFLKTAKAAKFLKLVKLSGASARYAHTARAFFTRHGLQYVLAAVAGLYALSAMLIWAFEQGGPSSIESPGEALWWGIASVTSLSNQGNEPGTTGGKAVAVFVAFLGLALVSVITANIAAFFVHSEEHVERASFRELRDQLDRIEGRLAAMDSGGAKGSE